MRRLVLLIILGLGIALAPARADALTVREIVELKRAGLGEEVLLALIEVDGGIFEINTSTLKMLKQAGVSDKVIEAMVRSGRTPRPAELAQVVPPAQPQHEVIVVEREPVVREFPVVVPVYIPIVTTTFSRHHLSRRATFFDPSPLSLQPVPPSVLATAGHPVVHKKAEPVYWGWGGKLRPDAWKPK
jgi:hypothetical protein